LILVNGEAHEVDAPPRLTLADYLRDRLRLTGTHLGCEHGVCGACTVLLDGEPARSCLVLAAQADGHEVVTVEGLTPPGGLSRLQQAFLRRRAFQCGFCTPGLLATATALQRRRPRPGREELAELLAGHICRCTGYAPILAAVEEALAE
jgi:aerobic carbon-monoxide dehydrogenase small subunit